MLNRGAPYRVVQVLHSAAAVALVHMGCGEAAFVHAANCTSGDASQGAVRGAFEFLGR